MANIYKLSSGAQKINVWKQMKQNLLHAGCTSCCPTKCIKHTHTHALF